MSDDTPGQLSSPTDSANHYNALAFFVRQMINSLDTATLVMVQAVRDSEGNTGATAGDVAPAGFVDVLPLVNDVDTDGNPSEHSTVFNLPYFRLQGGANGVICDPEVNDIGLAVFCDRDISSVKKNKDQSNPGSRRRFSMADGVYLGSLLGVKPNQYLAFQQGGVTVLDVNNNTIIMSSGGVVIADKNKNVITMSGSGLTITDALGSTIVTSQGGITITDKPNNAVIQTSGTAIVLQAGKVNITGDLTVQGDVRGTKKVFANFGAGAQVGLDTHDHGGVTAGAGVTGPPVAGS